MLNVTRTFVADLWGLTKPYWNSEERWSARGLLAVIVALNLGLVYVNVQLNLWNNDFYNTLQNKDMDGFSHQLMKFAVIAGAYIVIAVYQLYLNQMLQIRWRRWLTDRYLADWIGQRTYYRLQLTDRGTDNPDQRKKPKPRSVAPRKPAGVLDGRPSMPKAKRIASTST